MLSTMRLGSSFLKQSKFTRQFMNRRKALPTFNYLSVAVFCSKVKPPPEEFYDEEVEKDKELFDIYEVRQKGRSFETLTTNKTVMTWDQMKELTEVDLTAEYDSEYTKQFKQRIHEASAEIAKQDGEDDDIDENEDELDVDEDGFSDEGSEEQSREERFLRAQGGEFVGEEDQVKEPIDEFIDTITADDVGDHLTDFHGFSEEEMGDKIAGVVDEAEDEMPVYYHEEMLNYNLPWRKSIEFEDPDLDRFVPNDHEDKFRFDYRGYRACSGKRQRRGLNTQLSCHKIDLAELSYLDVLTLQRFLTHDSEILPRSESGLCQKCQRKVAKTIKRARHLGILPHIGEFVVRDSRPLSEGTTFQDSVQKNKRPIQSRTILK